MVIKCSHDTCAIGDDFDIDFAASTTCHGMKRFFNAWRTFPNASWNTARRIFWAFVTLVTVLLLCQQLADRFSHFFKFELKTEISVESTKSLLLPAVTLCNLNIFTKSRLTSMDMQLLENISFALTRNVIENYWERTRDNNWSSEAYWKLVEPYENLEQKILENYDEKQFTVDKWILRTGWQMKDHETKKSALLSCRIGRSTCSYENFQQILTPQGICYSLNYKAPQFYQKMPGGDAGINIVLDINQDEYTHFMLNGASGQYDCGGKVIINEWYDFVDSGMGFGIAPGFFGYASIRKIRRRTINRPPWARCADGASTDDNDNDDLPYSVRQCHSECTARHSIQACGCRLWYEPLVSKDVPVCGVARTTACLLLKSSAEEENVEEECVTSCLDACESTSYDVAASFTLIAANNTISAFIEYLKMLTGRNFTETQVMRNIIAIQVAYPELIVETMSSTQAQSVSSFLGDIGGQLGLFAGISLITLIELMEYPVLKLFTIVKKRRRYFHRSYAISEASAQQYYHRPSFGIGTSNNNNSNNNEHGDFVTRCDSIFVDVHQNDEKEAIPELDLTSKFVKKIKSTVN